MKKCPFCAEEILNEAIVCKHCGRDLKGGASQVQIVQPKKQTGCVAAGCAVFLGLIVVSWVATMFRTPAVVPPPTTTTLSAAVIASRAETERKLRIKPGDRVHITGCTKGELLVPVVNIWDDPAQRSSVVGHLSGDGRKDQGLSCQGSVVIVREVRVLDQPFYRIDTVIGSQTGWVSDHFMGRKFETSKCATFFREDPAAVAKCRAVGR